MTVRGTLTVRGIVIEEVLWLEGLWLSERHRWLDGLWLLCGPTGGPTIAIGDPTDETGQDIHKRPLGGKAWRDSDTSAPDTSGRPSPATKEQ